MAISMSKPLTCGYGGALGGTRTPNLLIRITRTGIRTRSDQSVTSAALLPLFT